MSLRRGNLKELRIILFEMFAVHLKIVCVYYIFVTLHNGLFYLIISYSILRLIIFIAVGCLETISNVAFNISDPLNDIYPRKEGFVCYENDLFILQRVRSIYLCD